MPEEYFSEQLLKDAKKLSKIIFDDLPSEEDWISINYSDSKDCAGLLF